MTQRTKTGGRQAGTPNRRTIATRTELQRQADPLTFLARVMNGEQIDRLTPTLADRMAAAKELRRVLVPDARERMLEFEIPFVAQAADVPSAIATVLAAVAAGQMTPGEGKAIADLLEVTRKAIETADLAERIARLEAKR